MHCLYSAKNLSLLCKAIHWGRVPLICISLEERLEVENTLWANTVLASGGCALQVVGPAGGCGLQVDVPCYM